MLDKIDDLQMDKYILKISKKNKFICNLQHHDELQRHQQRSAHSRSVSWQTDPIPEENNIALQVVSLGQKYTGIVVY